MTVMTDFDYDESWLLDEEIEAAAQSVRTATIEAEIAESLGLIVADASAAPGDSSNDRARLRRARDMLIEVEDQLLYVVRRDPALQPMIDSIVDYNIALTRRIE